MSCKSKGTKNENNISSTDFSQRVQEEEVKMKSLYLSKSAHELKNIFITISSVLQNFKLFPNASKAEREQFRLINSLCNFGLNLILDINTTHILDYTKVNNSIDKQSTKNTEEFNLIEVLDFCLKIFQARQRFDNQSSNINVNIYSDYQIPQGTKIKSINDIRLKQVIINLLSNAYKFTKKGEIKLSCFFTTKNKIRISISDTGTGISQDEMQKLFHPFQVVESNQKMNYYGSGLGLCIVKDILEAFHTQIRYKSQIGKGTEFWFDLDNLIEDNQTIIDQSAFITDSLLKMMNDINSGLKDNEHLNNCFEDLEEEDDDYFSPISKLSNVGDNHDNKLTNTIFKPRNLVLPPEKKVVYSKTTNQLNYRKKMSNFAPTDPKYLLSYESLTNPIKVTRSLSQTENMNCLHNSIFYKKPSKKYNIFICDDERQQALSTQNLIKRYFKNKNSSYSIPDIFILPDGIQCLFQTYQFFLQDNNVNLILMDQNMPFLKGNVVCSLIKSIKDFEKIAIYLITSDDKSNICKEANGIFSKPLNNEKIEEILHQQFFE